MAADVPGQPEIWSDGSRDEDPDALIGVAGAWAVCSCGPSGVLSTDSNLPLSSQRWSSFLFSSWYLLQGQSLRFGL